MTHPGGRPKTYATPEEKLEARRASQRRYANSVKGRANQKAWNDAHPEEIKEIQARARRTDQARINRRQHRKDHEARHPEKVAARKELNHAVEWGRIVKPSVCSRCGADGVIHGHHDDYSKPLEVEWLCVLCHTKEHQS